MHALQRKPCEEFSFFFLRKGAIGKIIALRGTRNCHACPTILHGKLLLLSVTDRLAATAGAGAQLPLPKLSLRCQRAHPPQLSP